MLINYHLHHAARLGGGAGAEYHEGEAALLRADLPALESAAAALEPARPGARPRPLLDPPPAEVAGAAVPSGRASRRSCSKRTVVAAADGAWEVHTLSGAPSVPRTPSW